MSNDEPAAPHTAPTDYDVVVLTEAALDAGDAGRVLSLHEGLDEPVVYHLLLPVEDAAAGIEATLGGLSAGEMLATPVARAPLVSEVDLEAIREGSRQRAEADLAGSVAAFEAAGARVTGALVDDAPIDALTAVVKQVDGREAIVVTRPHVVAEFFHVDWAAQARRHLDLPVLHLVEGETFDEQAGEGEGVTGV